MKKILLSSAVIISFIFYSIQEKSQAVQRILVAPPKSMQGNDLGPRSKITYKDGEYIGDVADAFYGNLQIKAVIRGGKISDIVFIQYPFERQTSIEINEAAIPFWKQEAISAQSAEVDIVTGATQSSEAFKRSLKSALIKAKG